MDILIELREMGYTKSNLSPLNKLFKQARLNLLLSHVVIDAMDVALPKRGELSKTTIHKLLEEDRLNRPPLQKNTIYAYCKVGDYEGCPIIQRLKNSYRPNIEQATVALPTLSLYETHYYPLESPVYKDITFVDSSKKEVGWYNLATNILWISDLGHYPEKIVNNFEHVLQTILSMQRTGTITPLPNLTIGADPEFEIFDGGNVFVPAHDIIADPDRTKDVGVDGHAETGELRPSFATNPIRLANNIKHVVKKLLRDPSISQAGYKVYCGGGIAKHLGGHIHFNIEMPANPQHLQHILYDLVGHFVRDGMNRKSRRYAERRYMDREGTDIFRVTDSHKGVEWRLLPSFILNENICKAILCTVWCVVKEYFGKGFGQEAYAPNEVEEVLRSLALYPLYSRWIDEFINLFIKQKTAMEEREMRDEWNVSRSTYTIMVTSTVDWIKEYFTPQNVKLYRNMRIHITTAPLGEFLLYTEVPISQEVISACNDFAVQHMVTFKYLNQTSNYDIFLTIPWTAPSDKSVAFQALKGLVKRIIVDVNAYHQQRAGL